VLLRNKHHYIIFYILVAFPYRRPLTLPSVCLSVCLSVCRCVVVPMCRLSGGRPALRRLARSNRLAVLVCVYVVREGRCYCLRPTTC